MEGEEEMRRACMCLCVTSTSVGGKGGGESLKDEMVNVINRNKRR